MNRQGKLWLSRHHAQASWGLIVAGMALVIVAAWTLVPHLFSQWRLLIAILGGILLLRGLLRLSVFTKRAESPLKSTAQPQSRAAVVTSSLSNLAAVFALIFTGLNLHATDNQLKISEQGQITDRYNAAISNLGSRSIDIRLGGIYALQRLMYDSPRDQPTIIAVLCAFVRDQGASSPKAQKLLSESLPTDVQAVLTVVGERNPANDGRTTVIDLDRTQLANARLGYLLLARANFSGADLSGADLAGAQLRSTDLAAANLDSADLTGANMTAANLIGANLALAHLDNSDLAGADFKDAKLSGTDFSGARLSQASFSGADLSGAILDGADIPGQSFAAATLTGADLSGADIEHGYLVAAELAEGTLAGANLAGADLTGANLTGADIRQANFKGANLSYANLNSAYVYGAQLMGADLAGANLTSANLNHADLAGANLTAADLTGVHLVDANLTGALWPHGAEIPRGWQREPNSGRLEQARRNPGP